MTGTLIFSWSDQNIWRELAMEIKRLGYRITDDDGKIFELVEKDTIPAEQIPTSESSEKMIREFFGRFKFVRYPMVVPKYPAEKPKEEEQSKKGRHGGAILEMHLAAGIPWPTQRQHRILQELDEFTIGDIGDHFSTKPDIEGKVYDKKKIIDNAYHDVEDLLRAGKVEYIIDTKPKKYRVIDKSMEGMETTLMRKMMKGKKVDLATHKEVAPL
jgi:hypothetical protein